jgi:hypothetical protein
MRIGLARLRGGLPMTFVQQNFWLGVSFLCLVGMAVFYVLKRIKLRRARFWPVEGGRVDSTSVRLVDRGEHQSVFLADVNYTYVVAEATYAGRLERSFMRKSSAEKWLAPYNSGLPLTVRYNPRDAKQSVILEAEQAVPTRPESGIAK